MNFSPVQRRRIWAFLVGAQCSWFVASLITAGVVSGAAVSEGGLIDSIPIIIITFFFAVIASFAGVNTLSLLVVLPLYLQREKTLGIGWAVVLGAVIGPIYLCGLWLILSAFDMSLNSGNAISFVVACGMGYGVITALFCVGIEHYDLCKSNIDP